MNTKKIVTFVIISVLISAGLYYGMTLLPDEFKEVMEVRFDIKTCVLFGIGFGIVYLLGAYKTKGISDEAELVSRKNEYFYNSFSNEQKAEIDALSSEDKARFYVEYEKLLSNEKKTALSNHMFDLQKEKSPVAVRALHTLALVGLIAFIGYYGYGTYKEAKPAMDSYMKNANAVYSNETLNIEGLPTIEIVGTLKQRDVDASIEENIKTQPEFLLRNVNSFKLADNKNYDKEENFEKFTLGYASMGDMSIYLNFYSSSKNTVSHELSHIFDYINGRHWASGSNEFKKLYNAKPNSITKYGSTNAQEFFAEAGAMYINNPKQLKSRNADVYNYFDNLYGQYMK